MQKKSFAQQLQKWVRKSGIRQNEIAGKLGVSAAAVSQFLHGQTLPTSVHLDQLLELIAPSAETSRHLRELWMLCRADPAAEGESELNHNLFLLRARKGFSLAQTAWETGISQARMTQLESDPNAKMTRREQDAFRLFFGCSPANAFSSSGEFPCEPPVAQVAENGSFGIPVIALSVLKEYDPACSLLEFAMMKRLRFLPENKNFCYEPVLILADNDELSLPHRGALQILLSQRRPQGFLPLDLCCYSGGIFRIHSGKGFRYDGKELPVSRLKDSERLPAPLWQLSIAEIIFRPVTME